ncbi:hypothetical protein CBS101457_003519 [Exobasidium rhododendri]|nr:hypothetical protein CBS101457_003519 [Exobasidium rhododendri]
MHPLNPYHGAPPDFQALAKMSDKLSRAIKGARLEEGDYQSTNSSLATTLIDFQDADSLRSLSEAILEFDFGLHVRLRDDRLCPPIPNRLNYVAWIQELMDSSQQTINSIYIEADRSDHHHDRSREGKEAQEEGRSFKHRRMEVSRMRILDIGTGASCIYPILGCALHGWEFVASDIDASSLEWARDVIEKPENNGTLQANSRFIPKGTSIQLSGRIHLVRRDSKDNLLLSEDDLLLLKLRTLTWSRSGVNLLYHAVMCNPPFYTSEQEMKESLHLKSRRPNAVCQGSREEMICEGGEVAFIARMIKESVQIGSRVIWFTSMIGKMSSINPLIHRLQEEQIDNYLLTEFVQGKTKRWGIAWSLTHFRIATPPLVVLSASLQQYKTKSSTIRIINFTLPLHTTTGASLADLQSRLDQLSIPHVRQSDDTITVRAGKDTWSRKARRARDEAPRQDSQKRDYALCLSVSVKEKMEKNDPQEVVLEARWLYGRDVQLFDGFVMSVLRRWVEQNSRPSPLGRFHQPSSSSKYPSVTP